MMGSWQINDKNLTTSLNRIKYDSELLLHYLFDGLRNSEDINVIKICKTRVKKTCGTMLAHYFAHIDISNGYSFEFHPGSQPRTFQVSHSDGNIIIVLILCDECCKNELRSFVDGENGFNVAFQNCESILCKRKSMQTVFVTLALAVIFLNMFKFSWFYIFLVIFLMTLLYINNNYMISDPRIVVCSHKTNSYNNYYFSENNNNKDKFNRSNYNEF
ncbi:hypothetical protein [Rachiplusia nu nucleopolyhedrovirus]|uniref:Ac81 n=1 Tax=Rachiplusia nu nucleopolyhedrovirus TaxID=2605775 RepID=A0AAE6IQS4_9ABAC|nr:hypothetical protein QKQ55_gp075 [Rachiplusia nu nucleopolyhedrovirus]QEI03675.1 hypothetical protein [Rachiplusia nu nucleopolyhedrovirus]